MKNLNLKTITNKFTSIAGRLKRSAVFIFIVLFIGIYGFLVFRINMLTRSEPTDAAVSEKLQTVKRPKIDQSALDKIQQLQDQNLDVKSLFDQARNNPFAE